MSIKPSETELATNLQYILKKRDAFCLLNKSMSGIELLLSIPKIIRAKLQAFQHFHVLILKIF